MNHYTDEELILAEDNLDWFLEWTLEVFEQIQEKKKNKDSKIDASG